MFEFISSIIGYVYPLTYGANNNSDIEDDYVDIPKMTLKFKTEDTKNIENTKVQNNDAVQEFSFRDSCIVMREDMLVCEACHFITRGKDMVEKMILHSNTQHHHTMTS